MATMEAAFRAGAMAARWPPPSGSPSPDPGACRLRLRLRLRVKLGLDVLPMRIAFAQGRGRKAAVATAMAGGGSGTRTTAVPGFTQLGEEVPEGLTLGEVVRSLPKEVFEVDHRKAFRSVAITVGAVAAGYAALAVAPAWLYPGVYAFLGTAVTGMFVVGHDCGHNSFSRSQLVNDVVGTLMMAPLMYPFEAWRIKHNAHHAHTNKLVMDTAWQPFRPHHFRSAGPGPRLLMRAAMGPFWWAASIGHWLLWHFDVAKFRPAERARVAVSLAAVAAFGLLVLAPLLLLAGPVAFVKWWLLPWLGFHFWMSTFTLLHHTAPHIPFKRAREWDAAAAQLNGTVHCDYPAWVDFLCHDISVHIPHHISSRIPSYNLRKAYRSLQQNWDRHLNKAVFGVPLIVTVLSHCNLFDVEEGKWVPFPARGRGRGRHRPPHEAITSTDSHSAPNL